MTLKDWLLILITAAVAVPISLFSPFGTEWLKKRRAVKSKSKAAIRDEELRHSLLQVESYKQDPHRLQEYLLGRLLLVSILWIGQEVVDYIIGIAVNFQYGAADLARSYAPLSTTAALTQAAESLIGTILLTVVLMIGIRSYRLYQHVRDYDKYREEVNLEQKRLSEIIGTSA